MRCEGLGRRINGFFEPGPSPEGLPEGLALVSCDHRGLAVRSGGYGRSRARRCRRRGHDDDVNSDADPSFGSAAEHSVAHGCTISARRVRANQTGQQSSQAIVDQPPVETRRCRRHGLVAHARNRPRSRGSPPTAAAVLAQQHDVRAGFLRHRQEAREHRGVVDQRGVADHRPVGQRRHGGLQVQDLGDRDGRRRSPRRARTRRATAARRCRSSARRCGRRSCRRPSGRRRRPACRAARPGGSRSRARHRLLRRRGPRPGAPRRPGRAMTATSR